LTRILGVILVK